MTKDMFWFLAGALASVAALVVVVPLLRAGREPDGGGSRHALWVGIAAFVGIGAATLGLYLWIGTPAAVDVGHASAGTAAGGSGLVGGPAPPSMEVVTARLAARLAAEGGTADEWRLLAQSYEFLGRPEEAAAARARGEQVGAVSSATAPGNSVAAGVARIEGIVDITPEMRERVDKDAALFIYARPIGAGGPPLAVTRTGAPSWPVKFTLDGSDAMIPGRDLGSVDRVLLEARISRSGNAIPQPGDLAGTIPSIDPRAGSPVRVLIDHVL